MPGRFTSSNDDRYKFTGHELDEEAGLDLSYAGARYLDSEIGSFLSIDPVADLYPGWSPYTYTLGNPVNLVDPTGMMSCDIKQEGYLDCLFAEIGEILKNSSLVDLNFNFGEDGETTATSEVSQEQAMMANSMLADLNAQAELIEGYYNGLEYVPGVDVAKNLYEGDYFEATVDVATLFIPAGKIGKFGKPILNSVNTGRRTGSAAYKSLNAIDEQHYFSKIVDNYASYADKFILKGGDGIKRNLYQIGGSLRGEAGVFEWLVESAEVVHRRFIPGGKVNGIINQIVK